MKIIVIISLFISSLLAHPHTFIEVYPTIKVQNNSLSIINFKWIIDDMTSAMLIMELDRDGDGAISEKENTEIEKNYFSLFEDYSYYTFITLDTKAIEIPRAKNFQAKIENNRVCYYFDIELNHNLKNSVFEFGDSDSYVAMVLKREFVSTQDLDVKVTRVDNELYFGYKLELQ